MKPQMTAEDRTMVDEFLALKAENDKLKAALAAKTGPRRVSLKVSDKGGVSVYGLGRFPVTLYRGQWEELFKHVESIQAFIAANAAKLSTKG